MIIRAILFLTLLAFAANVRADVFNMPAGQTSLQFVTVGDPGNAPDTVVMNDVNQTTGYGSVDHIYQIGKYDVTVAQYTQFLNAVAKTDPYSIYPNSRGITRSGSSGSYQYAILSGYENFPANGISWGNAMRFTNWLQNGQPSGAEGVSTTETGAYTLNGEVGPGKGQEGMTRNAGSTFFIPNENEWYKAAYYKGGSTNAGYWLYPTQSDSPPGNVLPDTGNNANYFDASLGPSAPDTVHGYTPVGAFALSPGPYGTFDQGGDVFQWNEHVYGFGTVWLRGGAYADGEGVDLLAAYTHSPVYVSMVGATRIVGFRVAAIPEPSAFVLSVLGLAALSFIKRSAV